MENLLDSKKEIFAHLDTIYANIEKAAETVIPSS